MAGAGPANTNDAARFDQSLSRFWKFPPGPSPNIREPVRDPERAIAAIVRLQMVEQCEREGLCDQRIHIGLRKP